METGEQGQLKRVIPYDTISTESVRSMVDFFKRYYFSANIRQLGGKVLLRQLQNDGNAYEFVFNLNLPPAPASVVTLTISQESVVVSSRMEGLPPESGRQEFAVLADGVELHVKSFLRYSRSTSVHFIFSMRRGESMESPDAPAERAGRAILRRIFRGNAMNLFLFFLLLSFVFVLILGDDALIAVIAFQSLILVFSDRLSLAVGSVRPTNKEPDVTVVSVQVTRETIKDIRRKASGAVGAIRRHLLESASQGNPLTESRGAVVSALRESGVETSEDAVSIKTRHVFGIVERAAGKFGLAVPKVVISNTPSDNASAMGVSPSRSTVTITAGALEDLADEELESVVGHELGHIKGRDPLILFALTSFMYIGGFYLWVPLLLFLGFFYFVFAFGIIFLVGKFLETRADTESANMVGRPEMLASALKTIGFSQLYSERYSTSVRVLNWLRFDPHPPTYFRVQRLNKMSGAGTKVRHTLFVSAKDCVTGFFRALAGE